MQVSFSEFSTHDLTLKHVAVSSHVSGFTIISEAFAHRISYFKIVTGLISWNNTILSGKRTRQPFRVWLTQTRPLQIGACSPGLSFGALQG